MAQAAPRSGEEPASLRVRVQAGTDQHVLMLRINTSLGPWAARMQPGAVAFEGFLPDLPASWVRVTRIGSRWVGMWFDGASYYCIDSAGAVASANTDAAAADPDSLVVYRLADVVSDGPLFMDDTVRPGLSGEALADLVTSELQVPATAEAVAATRRLTVGLIADAELVALDGAATTSNMLARLNVVDGIFKDQVGVRVLPGTPTLMDAATQPFSGTSAGGLLDQLKDYRGNNINTTQQGTGLSHLMTGRDLDGQTVGIAYLSDASPGMGVALCNPRFSASLSEARRFVGYDALIAAHEIGHVFGAPHDGETDPAQNQACAAEPTSFLMAATVNNSMTFSSCSLTQMAPIVEIAKTQCLAAIEADLSVAVSFDVSIVTVGSDTGALITVRNVGNSDATDAQLNVTLPAGLTLTSVTATGISCAQSGAAVSCTPSAVAVNATATVRLALHAAATGVATLGATVSSSVIDTQSTNNQAQASITVNSGAPPPPSGGSSGSGGSSSGGGKAGVELLGALMLLLAHRVWTDGISRSRWRRSASDRLR